MGNLTNNVLVTPNYNEPALTARHRTLIMVCVESYIKPDRPSLCNLIADKLNAHFGSANPEYPERDYRVTWCNANPTETL